MINSSTYSPERYVDSRAVCHHLGVSLKWYERRAVETGMPRYRVAGKWRHKLSEIDAWVANGMRPLDEQGPAAEWG